MTGLRSSLYTAAITLCVFSAGLLRGPGVEPAEPVRRDTGMTPSDFRAGQAS